MRGRRPEARLEWKFIKMYSGRRGGTTLFLYCSVCFVTTYNHAVQPQKTQFLDNSTTADGGARLTNSGHYYCIRHFPTDFSCLAPARARDVRQHSSKL